MIAPVISEDELEGDFIPTYWSLWFFYALFSLLLAPVIGGIISIAWFGWNIYRDFREDSST